MGGNDLGSDDDYFAAPLKTTAADDGAISSSDDDDDFRIEGDGPSSFLQGGDQDTKEMISNVIVNKRKRDNAGENGNSTQQQQSSKKRSKKERQGGPLQGLGTKIRDESLESKARLLSGYTKVQFLPQHIARPNNNDNLESNNFMERLMCLISKKQLKKTSLKASPRAIILCLSARRCVTVLKDLAPLRLRIAKLFPKQGTVEDQAKQLENSEFAVAVGTPHRVKELMERGSLFLKDTQLFGLDVFENDKNFSVYTLADTSPHVEDLLKDHVHPQLSNKQRKKGNDLKVAFV
jgi:hypothetical protein